MAWGAANFDSCTDQYQKYQKHKKEATGWIGMYVSPIVMMNVSKPHMSKSNRGPAGIFFSRSVTGLGTINT